MFCQFHREVTERLGREFWSYSLLSSPTNTRPIPRLWMVAHSHRCVVWTGKRNNTVCVRKRLHLFISGHQRNGEETVKWQRNAHPGAMLMCLPGNE